jgi:hypothetical protein
MWTPELISRYLQEKIAQMIARIGLTKESVEKSLRRYETSVHPLLLERLQVHGILPNESDSLTTTSSYAYYHTDQGLRGNRLMNYIFQSLFDQEEPEFGGNVLYVSASRKTMDMQLQEGLVMDSAIRLKVLSLNGGSDQSPLPLATLASSLLGDNVVADLLESPLHINSLGRSINDFLHFHECKFPHDQFVTIPSRTVRRDLVMTTKYYPSRDDYRAYCRDTNLLRHLCGICLHRLLTPENMSTRQALERECVIPAKGKDILKMVLPIPRKHEVALLILGDVSNFTGSLGNSWLMLYCMALELARGGAWEKLPNLYSVKGALVSGTWYQIIVIYLYLNVGYPAYIEELGEDHCLPGGFLGVAANITVGLLFLAVVLQNLINLLKATCRVVKAQAGGDDFAFGLIVSSDDKGFAVSLIREHISKYVGNLKEFHVIDLGQQQEGKLGDHTFCKKWIKLRKHESCFILTGQDNIPVTEALLPNGTLKASAVEERWLSYDMSLQLWEKTYGHHEQVDALRALFLYTYPTLAPLSRRQVTTRAPDSWQLQRVGRKLITENALRFCGRYPDVILGDVTYIGELADKIHHCLKCDTVTCRKIQWMGKEELVVCCKREVRELEKDESSVLVGLKFDQALLVDLLNLMY